MTAIVAYIEKETGDVYVGQDTLIIHQGTGDAFINGADKIIKIGKSLIIAFAGDVSFINVFQRLTAQGKIKEPPRNKSVFEWVILNLMPTIKKESKGLDFDMLVICRGEIIIVDNEASAVRPTDNIASIGSGGIHAEMALRGMLQLRSSKSTTWKIHTALTLTGERNKFIAPPYKIFKNGKLQEELPISLPKR